MIWSRLHCHIYAPDIEREQPWREQPYRTNVIDTSTITTSQEPHDQARRPGPSPPNLPYSADSGQQNTYRNPVIRRWRQPSSVRHRLVPAKPRSGWCCRLQTKPSSGQYRPLQWKPHIGSYCDESLCWYDTSDRLRVVDDCSTHPWSAVCFVATLFTRLADVPDKLC